LRHDGFEGALLWRLRHYSLPCYFREVSTVIKPHRTLRRYLSLVKFEHTLFALPFAYGSMLLAARGWPGWSTFAWITLAMVAARTASMALNRLVDADIDALNPRTRDRELPSGRLSRGDALALVIVGFALLALAGWALNPLTLALLPIALFFLVFYPYTKRLTWLCHYWLGLTIGAAAAGGWIAVRASFSLEAELLWAAVALWIAGFDIIYALLDLRFDREHHLHSIPARFGVDSALRISALTHALAFVALLLLLPVASLGWPYALSLLGVAGILFYQHLLINQREVSQALASFQANLYIGAVVLAGIIFELLVRS